MTYWKIILLVLLFLLPSWVNAQSLILEKQQLVEDSLRAKYSSVQYHSQGGGWYLLSTIKNDSTYYSMADSRGNIVVSGAIEYVLYEGYIKVHLKDTAQIKKYAQWIELKNQYEADYHRYSQIKAEYEEVLRAYQIKVAAARQEADARYNKAVLEAQQTAQEEYKQKVSNSTGLFGGVINAIGTVAVSANAANKVDYDLILTKVLEETNLLVPPAQPYNPQPTLPQEPANGYYWRAFTYEQPCPYSEVDYDAITSPNTFANVKRNGKYGVVNSMLEEVISCEYDEIRSVMGENQKLFFLVQKNGLLGVCTDQGEQLLACEYSNIHCLPNLFVVSLPNHSHGLVDYNSQPLFPFVSDSIIRVLPNYILLADSCGRYGALNYRGEVIVSVKNKLESISKKVEQYAKKNDLVADNVDVLERIRISYEAFAYRYDQMTRQKNTFSYFAKNYVEQIINEWQKKGEFEKITDWQKRVNGETRKQKVFMLTKDAEKTYIDKCVQRLPADVVSIVGSYDPDNETYRVRTKYREEDILVSVAMKDAMTFKSMFSQLRKEPTFYVENDTIALAEYKFYLSDDVIYKFNNEASLTYNIAQVDYNFDDISIDPVIGSIVSKGKQTFSTSNITIGNSDVDIHIPVTDKKQENTFVVIIANKNYDEAPNVDYAFNDGYMFKEYCIKTLGIPSNNIRFKEDATFNNIRESVNWIRDIATNKVYRGNSKFIFYYSGHGVPDELTRSMYLLPKDGVAMNIATTGYNISDLYRILAETSSESLVLLDACFSGFAKSGSALASTKGVVKVTAGAPKGNTVVFSASSSNEVALQYEEKSHGLFTYYLLKKLQETEGNVSLGELFDYIEKEVVRTSVTKNHKSQTPSAAAGSSALEWEERML